VPLSPAWLRLAIAVLVVVGGTVGSAVPASSSSVAGARTDLQKARVQLRDLDVRLSLIAEQIHQGKVLLKTLKGEIAAARDRSDLAQHAADTAAAELDATARRAYEGVGTSGLAALIGSNSVTDFLQGVDYLSQLVQRNEQVAEDAVRARRDARETSDRVRSLAAAEAQVVEQLRGARSQMRSAVAAQRRLIGELEQRLTHEIALAVAARLAAREAARQAALPPPPPPSGPAPPPENQIDSLIYSIWGHGPDGRVAECIADHESHDNPNARNGSGASGLFQLMPFWWDGNNAFGWKFDPYDARANAQHAYLIWKRDGWNPWTTRPLCT
jgi:peptidoglycan hydrolase CwlO-like protein